MFSLYLPFFLSLSLCLSLSPSFSLSLSPLSLSLSLRAAWKTSFSLSGQPSSSFAGDLQAILCSVYKLYVVTASFQDFANVGAELDVLHSPT